MEPAPKRAPRPAPTACSVFSDEEAWDVLEDIPNDSAAALLLLEHHWAVPLRDAIARAGGFRISDGFISPLDLVEIGLVSAEEAERAARGSRPAASPRRPSDTTTNGDTDVRITQSRPAHLAPRRTPPLAAHTAAALRSAADAAVGSAPGAAGSGAGASRADVT